MAITAAVIGVATAVGSTGAAVYSAKKQGEAAQTSAVNEQNQIGALEAQASDQQTNNQKQQAAAAAAASQTATAANTSQRAGALKSTILTSPLGQVSAPQTAQKTLLGS